MLELTTKMAKHWGETLKFYAEYNSRKTFLKQDCEKKI